MDDPLTITNNPLPANQSSPTMDDPLTITNNPLPANQSSPTHYNFNGGHRTYRLFPATTIVSIIVFFQQIAYEYVTILEKMKLEMAEFKIHFKLSVVMERQNESEHETEIFIPIKAMEIKDANRDDIVAILDKKVEEFTRLPSGFKVKRINYLDISLCKYKSVCVT